MMMIHCLPLSNTYTSLHRDACHRGHGRVHGIRCQAFTDIHGGPDLWLEAPNNAKIAVFGTVHADTEDSRIGRFIVEEKPHSVVVETALNPSHGSETGNSVNLESCLRVTPDGPRDSQTLGISQLAARLKDTGDILASSVWKDLVASNMIYSEHLAYVAALCTDANLVYGDRPKLTTYQRMLMCPTLADLDTAFGIQCASNYHDLVSNAPFEKDLNSTNVTEKILFEERDAVLVKSLYEAGAKAGSGALVVGVVGSSHLQGMSRLWEANTWSTIAEDACSVPHAGSEEKEGESFGIRRALFDGVIRLTCRPDVTYDAAVTLGPPPANSMDAYELTSELYGSTRMLLATLDREQLKAVCSGWRCDPWELLEPLRAVRPCNGGPGYDQDLVMNLRTLNFELS